MAMCETDGTRWELAALLLARACTPLNKPEENKRLLAVY